MSKPAFTCRAFPSLYGVTLAVIVAFAAAAEVCRGIEPNEIRDFAERSDYVQIYRVTRKEKRADGSETFTWLSPVSNRIIPGERDVRANDRYLEGPTSKVGSTVVLFRQRGKLDSRYLAVEAEPAVLQWFEDSPRRYWTPEEGFDDEAEIEHVIYYLAAMRSDQSVISASAELLLRSMRRSSLLAAGMTAELHVVRDLVKKARDIRLKCSLATVLAGRKQSIDRDLQTEIFRSVSRLASDDVDACEMSLVCFWCALGDEAIALTVESEWYQSRGPAQAASLLYAMRHQRELNGRVSKAAVGEVMLTLLRDGLRAEEVLGDMRRWQYWDGISVVGKVFEDAETGSIIRRNAARLIVAAAQDPMGTASERAIRQEWEQRAFRIDEREVNLARAYLTEKE